MAGTVPGLTLRQFLMVCVLALTGIAVLGGGLRVLDRASGAARGGAAAVKSAPRAVPEDDDRSAVTPIPVATQSLRFDAPTTAPDSGSSDVGPRTAATLRPPIRSEGADRTTTASIAPDMPQARPEPVRQKDRPHVSARSRRKSAERPGDRDRRGRRSRRHVIASAPVETVRISRGTELASTSRSTSSAAVCWQLKSGGGRCVDRDLATSRAAR